MATVLSLQHHQVIRSGRVDRCALDRVRVAR
jgi:hypothetical protein